MIVERDLVALIDERIEAVTAEVESLRLMAMNVRMANGDDEKYVVLDNLRRMPAAIAQTHLRLGRLNAVVEAAEEAASRWYSFR